MMDVELVPIGALDRRNLAERRLKDFLWRVESGRLIDFPAEEQMYVLLYYFLAVVRRRAGLHRRYRYRDALVLEFSALVKVQQGNSLDPIYKDIADALAVIDEDPSAAKNILETMMGDRKKQFSAIQRKRRKGSLAESALDSEIRKILKRNLEQTWRDVKDKLERRVGLGVIIEVSESEIKYFARADSDEEASLKVSTLKNKVGAIRTSISQG